MKYELTDGDHRLVWRARIALAYAAEDGRSVHDVVHEQSVRGLMGLLIRILDAEGVCDPDEETEGAG